MDNDAPEGGALSFLQKLAYPIISRDSSTMAGPMRSCSSTSVLLTVVNMSLCDCKRGGQQPTACEKGDANDALVLMSTGIVCEKGVLEIGKACEKSGDKFTACEKGDRGRGQVGLSDKCLPIVIGNGSFLQGEATGSQCREMSTSLGLVAGFLQEPCKDVCTLERGFGRDQMQLDHEVYGDAVVCYREPLSQKPAKARVAGSEATRPEEVRLSTSAVLPVTGDHDTGGSQLMSGEMTGGKPRGRLGPWALDHCPKVTGSEPRGGLCLWTCSPKVGVELACSEERLVPEGAPKILWLFFGVVLLYIIFGSCIIQTAAMAYMRVHVASCAGNCRPWHKVLAVLFVGLVPLTTLHCSFDVSSTSFSWSGDMQFINKFPMMIGLAASDPVRLWIVPLTGKPGTIEVMLTDLVEDVESKAQSINNLPYGLQRFTFAGKPLTDGGTVQDCGICDGSVLRARGGLRGGSSSEDSNCSDSTDDDDDDKDDEEDEDEDEAESLAICRQMEAKLRGMSSIARLSKLRGMVKQMRGRPVEDNRSVLVLRVLEQMLQETEDSQTAASSSQSAASSSQSAASSSKSGASFSQTITSLSQAIASSSQSAATSTQAAASLSQSAATSTQAAASSSQTGASSIQVAASLTQSAATLSHAAAPSTQTTTASSQQATAANTKQQQLEARWKQNIQAFQALQQAETKAAATKAAATKAAAIKAKAKAASSSAATATNAKVASSQAAAATKAKAAS